jgi:hypothetical protein
MTRNGSSVNRQEAVALALAVGQAVQEAANTTGVGRRTIYRWFKRPAFRRRIAELRAELFGQAVGRLANLAGTAAQTLAGLLESQSETVRLQAARAVLDLGPRLRESTELAAQVAELRAAVEGNYGLPKSGTPQTEEAGAGRPTDWQLNAGGPPGGPGAGAEVGGDVAGPVAGETAAIPFTTDDGPLLSPGGQEYGSRCLGVKDGLTVQCLGVADVSLASPIR